MRVMFVDDEKQVLRGISRMLDSAAPEWDVETATSAVDALESMHQKPVDVLVSDMQMPGMDGAELLENVSRLYPDTIRIILSGQANRKMVYRAARQMHQYLPKPCDSAVLRAAIERACILRETLVATRSCDFVGRICNLPSLPDLYQKVVAEVESDRGTVARVGEIIARDAAMTAKLLQIANSAIFGFGHQIRSVAQAASLIGMESLKTLILGLEVFRSFDGSAARGFCIDKLMTHSLRVATIARTIAQQKDPDGEMANECFTAGLLHDIGKLILASSAAEEYATVMRISESSGLPVREAEQSAFGLAHDRIGGYLLDLWGIPPRIVEAVTFHHLPDQYQGICHDLSRTIYLANFLAHEAAGLSMECVQKNCEQMLEESGQFRDLEYYRTLIRATKEET